MSLVTVERRGRVALLRLNRPEKLNALSAALLAELTVALEAADGDDGVGAIVVTGGGRAFCVGGDVAEMARVADFVAAAEAELGGGAWEGIARCRKPVLAAVNGPALGGGCELALMCDFILAGEGATFAQPEIKLGTIPGAGGTQRLARAVGKALAMELCLTGRAMGAREARRAGMVARVVADDELMDDAWRTGETIARYSLPVARMVKAAVKAADEMPLAAGVLYERRLFHATFGLADRAEGMEAFVEKRAAVFSHK